MLLSKILQSPLGVEVFSVDLAVDSETALSCQSVLPSYELERTAEFSKPDLRIQYVVRHAALRRLLSERTGCPPQDIEICTGQKPYLADHSFHFNCSSSEGLAIIALSRDHSVGVDIQSIIPELDIDPVLMDQFGKSEIEWVRTTANPDRSFYHGWVRKEAIAKAFGWGVAADWKAIEVLPQVVTGGALYEGRDLVVQDIEIAPNTFTALATIL